MIKYLFKKKERMIERGRKLENSWRNRLMFKYYAFINFEFKNFDIGFTILTF